MDGCRDPTPENGSPFPLPLAPFEHYILEDDRDDYPMCLWGGLSFRERIDAERLRRAVAQVQARHLLLHAVVRGRPGGRTPDLAWAAAGSLGPPIIECERAPTRETLIRRIDLARETGVRFFLSPEGRGSRLECRCTTPASTDGAR